MSDRKTNIFVVIGFIFVILFSAIVMYVELVPHNKSYIYEYVSDTGVVYIITSQGEITPLYNPDGSLVVR